MDNFTYSNPVKMLFGPGQLDHVAEEITPYGKKVLLVYGQEHIKKCGVYDRVVDQLQQAGLEYVELGGVRPNPRLSKAREGIALARQEGVDFILAVGGGSVSDTAKAIGMGAKADYDVWQMYEDFHAMMHGTRLENPHIPEACIPLGVVMTKAGTGSEFDYTSVLTNDTVDTREKLMVINKVMYPKFAVLRPDFGFHPAAPAACLRHGGYYDAPVRAVFYPDA